MAALWQGVPGHPGRRAKARHVYFWVYSHMRVVWVWVVLPCPQSRALQMLLVNPTGLPDPLAIPAPPGSPPLQSLVQAKPLRYVHSPQVAAQCTLHGLVLAAMPSSGPPIR